MELFDAIYERYHADVVAMKDSVSDSMLGLVFQPLTKTLLRNSCQQRHPDGAGYNSQGPYGGGWTADYCAHLILVG